MSTSKQKINLHKRVSALFAGVHEVHDDGPEMSQRGDGLHLDGVALLERMVQDSRRVYHLKYYKGSTNNNLKNTFAAGMDYRSGTFSFMKAYLPKFPPKKFKKSCWRPDKS